LTNFNIFLISLCNLVSQPNSALEFRIVQNATRNSGVIMSKKSEKNKKLVARLSSLTPHALREEALRRMRR
jgi:hypothetical protein